MPRTPSTTPSTGLPLRRRRRPTALITVGVLLVAAIGAGGFWWLNRDDGRSPDSWDERVSPLVAFVEQERNLEFDHPVPVEFLDEDEFEREVTTQQSELTDDEREEIRRTEAILRALGLFPHDGDLLAASNSIGSGSVLGLYDQDDKRIRVRGTELTLAVQRTVVHELTHALQDQHFGLAAVDARHERDKDSGAAFAWDALIEGDADRIAEAWRESLDGSDRESLDEEQGSWQEQAGVAEVPPFLTTLTNAPYVLGGGLVLLAARVGGPYGVDDLFADPPTSEEHLIDPWTLLDRRQKPLDVAVPAVGPDDVKRDEGTFGAAWWLFMLAERIDPAVALTAADGWGGDQYVDVERRGRSCTIIDYVGDTARDVTELRTALETWIDRGPDAVASVRARGKGLRFTSCDPGDRAVPGTGGSDEALDLAFLRQDIAEDVLSADYPEVQAQCVAERMVLEFSATWFRSDSAITDGTSGASTPSTKAAYDPRRPAVPYLNQSTWWRRRP